MLKVPFIEVCNIEGGTQPPKAEWLSEPRDGYVRMLQIRDFTQSERLNIEYVKENSNLKKCVDKDILIARYGASIGKILTGLSGAYNVAMAKCVWDKEKLCRDFLFFWLKSSQFQLAINNLGGRAAQAGFNKKDFENIEIPLPPLAEQKRIAGILDAADALRAKRRESLAQLDNLLQSTFLDMFGDPVTNPKGWKTEVFDEWLSSIDSGWSPQCLDRSACNDEWGVLKLGAVTRCEYDEKEQKALPDNLKPRQSIEVRAGDLLFTRKNTYELVAAVAYVYQTRSKLMLSDLVFRFRLKPESKIEPMFLWKLLTQPHQRKKIQELAGGAAGSMPNISKAKLKTVKLIKPPHLLQRRFASIVESVEKQKEKVRAHLAELDALFASLQSRAFNGEL